MISKSKIIYLLILIFSGLIDKSNGQNKKMGASEFQKKFHNIVKQYEKLDNDGVVIITQVSDNKPNLYRFSRLESQEMLLKNKPSSYFIINKKLVLYYEYTGLEKNISFDSTINDTSLFKLLIAKSNRKLIDDFPKSKYLIISTYNPPEWIVRVDGNGSGVYDKEATMKIKTGNSRWNIR